MFWNNFYFLCKEHKKTPTEVVEELCIARGSITKWKNGTLPSKKNLSKIADYFGVSVGTLFDDSGKNKKSPSGIPEELLESLAKDPVKLELAKIISSWDSDKVDRAMQLLSASLLLPKEDSKQ